jgi:DNA-binding transcriptional ArsR family regulator
MSQKHELGFMDSSNIERISKASANETRLLIFEVIARNKEMTSSTIVTLRRVAAATVSHHLKILSHAGLIECRRHGHFVHNRVVPRTIEVPKTRSPDPLRRVLSEQGR